MCGIAGIAGDRTRETAVRAMLDRLVHRGPDEDGVLGTPGAILGSRRLAIIDIEGSHQPLASPDGRHVLCFNGEILNYEELRSDPEIADWRWRTRGDTEVLLALLARKGPAALAQLNGQFAGALWDTQTRRLLLFRDRIGIVPLHYALLGQSVAFASTVGALLALRAVDAAVDPDGLRDLFTFWAPHPPHTMCRGVRQLPPGCFAVAERGAVTVRRYWEPAFTGALAELPEAEKTAMLHDALAAATGRTLHADQEVGVLISGGIDSAMLCALAARGHAGRPSFSMTFTDPRHDESAFQALVAQASASRHTAVLCTADAIAAALPAAVEHTGTPFLRFSPAASMLMSATIHDAGVKTVVSGEGADEIFYGYDLFKEAALRARGATVGSVAGSGVGGTPGESLPPRVLAVMLNDGADERFVAQSMRWNAARQAGAFVRRDVLDAASADPLDALFAELPAVYAGWSAQARAACVELRTLLPDYILSTQSDRMLMANSVEGRFPFLDNEVVDLALALADDDKLRGPIEKHIVKQAARGLVPDAIIERHKQAYRAPVGEVLRSATGRELAAATLTPAAIESHGIFDPRKIEWLAKRLRADSSLSNTHEMALAAVVTTQLWLDAVAAQRQTMEDIAA